jgi:dTDP-4-dehydrorhamnose 3,5-epimerase
MQFVATEIPDVVLIEPRVFGDARGFFMETWRADQFAGIGGNMSFVQDNHSRSGPGVLRGLHYQLQRPQGKLVRAVAGAVFDVAVDLRRSSPTFGRWVGRVLSAENKLQLWIPPGFAHGFYVLGESAETVYKCTEFYSPEHDRCLLWNDPDLAISWPLSRGQAPALSQKDAAGRPLRSAECFE